ncbi:hypothetical protein LCGC14_2141510 [marine sediment metagenome]|uniref:Uncharacterized protein n=1 Tax=marine sediment metagenome TaxID=412755 RepID=A0A0F9GUL2_9ZZZZ
MLKIQTDRTKAMDYGPRLNQVGARLKAPMYHELMSTLGVMDNTNLRVKLRFITLQEVSNGQDDVLPRQAPQNNYDNINAPPRVAEHDPIKGRSAELIIFDDPRVPVGPELSTQPSTPAPSDKDTAIGVDDYIELDLT